MANVFMGVPALQGPPDISNALKMLSDGLEERRTRQQGRAIGSQLAAGNYKGAETEAFNQGDVSTGLKLHELSKDQQTQFAQTVARIAASATDEQSWEPIRQKLSQLTGTDPGDFATGRTELINEASTVDSILSRQDKAQERGAKAPDVVEIFDQASGQPQKMTWDSASRKFVPLGGPKTDEAKAPTVSEIYDPVTHLPQKVQWDAAQKKFVPLGGVKAPTKGIRVTTDADGNITTEIGGEDGGIGNTELGRVEQSQVQASESAGRIAGMMADFKPEYQTIGTRLANTWSSLKAKVDPGSLGPGEQKALGDFASFRRKTFEDLNTYLHDMSGAAISPSESQRLVQSRPNPGTGIFDGDDPITFKRKMEDIMDQTQKALVRLNYYKTTGIPASLDKIPLNNVKKVGDKWYVKDGDKIYEVGAPPEVSP